MHFVKILHFLLVTSPQFNKLILIHMLRKLTGLFIAPNVKSGKGMHIYKCFSFNFIKCYSIKVFLKRFEKPKRSLKIVQRSLETCKFLLKQSLTAVLFTNLKIGGLSKLLNKSTSQTMKKNIDSIH